VPGLRESSAFTDGGLLWLLTTGPVAARLVPSCRRCRSTVPHKLRVQGGITAAKISRVLSTEVLNEVRGYSTCKTAGTNTMAACSVNPVPCKRRLP